MHLTQQQQLNQMCPPPLGPPAAAWFMNSQPSGLHATPMAQYHNYHNHNNLHNHNHQSQVQQHQNYYDSSGATIVPTQQSNIGPHNSSATSTTNAAGTISSNNISVPQQPQHQNQLHHQHTHQHQQSQPQQHHQQQQQHHHHQPPPPPPSQQTSSPYTYNSYHHQQQSQLQQPHQNNHQQYNQIHHQQQLTIQQPQSQHVHQQPSPILQPQISPHTTSQPRPSPTLHQHQQPSPNYQQHSPHLTSPSLQPSPVLHLSTQQSSPINRHQQPTPPHHPSTPHSQHHNSRPASVKDIASTATITHQLSNIPQTEIRILELNRRLQCRPSSFNRTNPLPSRDQYEDLAWWEEFMNDFFREDATLTLLMQIDDRQVRYVLKRALILRFFRSYFDGGVTEMAINLRNSKEIRGGGHSVLLECDHANIITKNILKHPKINTTPRVVVCTEGNLSLEFVSSNLESLMIKSWKFKINLCREYIDRSITAIGLPSTILVEPTTFHGLPHTTMLYLKMCSIIEPMQDIMAQHKHTSIEPRACLKQILFEKYRFLSEDDSKVNTNKRRKRKQPNTTATPKVPTTPKKSKISTTSGNNPTNNASTNPPLPSLPPISVVGEPSPMGDYHDDNERSINKIENSNHIPENSVELETNQSPDPTATLTCDSKDSKDVVGDTNTDPIDNHPEIEKLNHPDLSSVVEPETEIETVEKVITEQKPTSIKEEEPSVLTEEQSRPVSEEPAEKENTNSALTEETQTNSTATQSEHNFNIMNSIPEDREDNCRSTSCDSIVLPPSSNSKNLITTNGTSNKQNRRRSSERKETLREGLMRTSDFVVAMKDLKCEHPALWRITTGNNLLQQFEPKTQNGVVVYENTNQYAGWNPEIRRDYVGVDVRLTQHTRNQITVERLLLNFQKLDEPEVFYDKHFVIYLQILISTALDPDFWESIEGEPKHHDYFVTSRKIIEDTIKRHKLKLASKLKLSETALKNFEKYPNLLIKPIEQDEKSPACRACNTNPSTQLVTLGNRSYDLHSYKPVKVTSEPNKADDKNHQNNLCDTCLEIVKLYSEIHHMGWKFYQLARDKVDNHRTKGKPINAILDECIKDEEWLAKIYVERDELWSKVETIQ